MAGTTAPVWAEAPGRSPRPARRGGVAPAKVPGAGALVSAAKLSGITAYVVADLATGRVLEEQSADQMVPPASVAKTITALYALERLGPDYQFRTQVMAVGAIAGGRLDGDLILVGGGDPTLDTDRMGDLVAALAATGLREVTGRFIVFAGALPAFQRIAADQPDHVGYNPGLCGLNLNFNRVYFEWKRSSGKWSIAMDARGERFVPPVQMARMKIADRDLPVFTQAVGAGVEDWTVASTALIEDGSRWLPIRQPGVYVAEVFQTLCAAQGIRLQDPVMAQSLPSGARVLAEDRSEPLIEVLRDMLKFSTNITAEAVGLTASGAASLADSGAAMTVWAKEAMGTTGHFVDHSGLGAASRVTARDLLRALLAARKSTSGAALRGILRDVGLHDDKGREIKDSPVQVQAKSGTLNFVSGLAGYIAPPGGQDMAFAVFSADVPRREALPMSEREDPEGGKAWVKRARVLQGQLIRRWAQLYG